MKIFSQSTKQGFVLILTLILMTALIVMVGTMMYMITYELRGVASQTVDVNLECLADAGIEKAHRAIRDDYLGLAPSPGSATGVADLRGGDTSLSNSVTNPDRMRYINTGGSNYATINANGVIGVSGDYAILRTFDSNYANTKIMSAEIHAIAVRSGGSGSNNIVVGYTTNGSSYTTVIDQAIPSSVQDLSAPVTGLTWATVISPNFRLGAVRTGTGNRDIRLYSMYLRVTYGIDTLKERWATGGYATFPISLNGGTIQSISITDETSKIHLNYASQPLLQNLLTNLNISNAATKATAIVNYRGVGVNLTNPFDSVEELQRVTGITASDYNTIKDYVTVYSFINANVYRPNNPPPRAPININTASNQVLKSVFDSLGLGAGDAQQLANDIITQRGTSPFKGFYLSSAAASDNTYFYNFVVNRGYISTSGNPDERDKVLDTADASLLIPISGDTAYACPTTEFCYASTAFYIDILARVDTRNFRVKTLRGNNDVSHAFSTYVGDTALAGWRKENFE